jgi:hypothetical protein
MSLPRTQADGRQSIRHEMQFGFMPYTSCLLPLFAASDW